MMVVVIDMLYVIVLYSTLNRTSFVTSLRIRLFVCMISGFTKGRLLLKSLALIVFLRGFRRITVINQKYL